MISKQQISFVRSLQQKKYRQMYGKFLVEGDKLVRELLASPFKIQAIYKTAAWNGTVERGKIDVIEVTEEDLRKISTHEHPNQVLAVAEMPAVNDGLLTTPLPADLYVACDHLSDPGNAGTIIRTADWFGVGHVFFSESSVDVFNPKVVSAAKGSLFRVQCHVVDLKGLFAINPQLPVYGTFMDGENLYTGKLAKSSFILIGNEANGIGEELTPFITNRITIPNYGKTESLNAAVAAGLVLGEMRRNT